MGPHGIAVGLPKFVAVLFWVPLVFLLAVNLGAAQDLEVSGEFEVGFGRVKLEGEDTKGLDGIGEATVTLSGEKGEFSAQVEIVLAESGNPFDSAEHELVWSPTDHLAITISGSSLEMEATESNISVVNAPSGPVGDEEANLDFSGAGLLNVNYSSGALSVGAALLDKCVPQCGYGLKAGNPNAPDKAEKGIAPDTELMTTLVHLMGQASPFTYKAYFARSSGTFSSPVQEGRGQGGGFGIIYSSADFRAALDYSAATVKCNANAGDTACSAENKVTQYGLSLNVAGFGLHYYIGVDKTGAAEIETTNIDAVYLIEVGDALVGPEFRTTKNEPSPGKATTDTFLLFGMSLDF